MKWDAELSAAIKAANAAASVLRATYAEDAVVQGADGKDLKTEADLAAEQAIVAHLTPTTIPILSEETVREPAKPDGLRWIVDPLDGTVNFARHFQVSAVSIALWEGLSPLLGVILDLGRGVLYTGGVGRDALRDSSPIRVSRTPQPAQAVLATGMPTRRDYESQSLARFFDLIREFKKIRMIGSAAMSLALVADGTFDAYTEEDIMIWDIAAGAAIVSAAGGICTIQPGRAEFMVNVRATNGLFSV